MLPVVVKVPAAGLYNSAAFVRTGKTGYPPATKTCPFERSVAVEWVIGFKIQSFTN